MFRLPGLLFKPRLAWTLEGSCGIGGRVADDSSDAIGTVRWECVSS
jgi:hypothetical protein